MLGGFRDIVYATAETLGPTTRKYQDWFNENSEDIQALLDENIASTEHTQKTQKSTSKKTALSNIRHTVQWKLREMQDSWLSSEADEIQSYDDRHDV